MVRVGQVTVLAPREDLALAISLAERADQPASWYGLGRLALEPLTLVVVRGQAALDQATRGRLPAWGAGLAVPAARLIVVRADGDDPVRVLRHELAHLALHQTIKGRVPLWFDEGYAVVASGEFGRLDGLRLNVAVALGRVPTLPELDRGLRDSRAAAEASYALAGTAVSWLARRPPAHSLEPLLHRLAGGEPFDSAVARTTGLSPGRFELEWRRQVRRDYGVALWLAAGGFWVVVAILVIATGYYRRVRDRPRRAALDVGWDVPVEPEGDPRTGPPS
jgi:hypothetical protein